MHKVRINILLVVIIMWPGLTTAMTTLDAAQDRYDLARDLEVLVDLEGAMTFEMVRADGASGFTTSDSPGLTFGFSPAAYWFHGRIENRSHSESRWIMAIAYSLLDDIDLYLIDHSGKVNSIHSGDRSPFANRSLGHRQFNFAVELPQGRSLEFYLRVRSESSIQVPLVLKSLPAFSDDSYSGQLGLGLLYGILVALSLYNLVLFISVRDRTYLYYVLYVISFGLLQMTLNGITFQYFWPQYPDWANTVLLLLMSVAILSMLQFCRSFLDLRRLAPRLDRVFVVFMGLSACAVVAAFLVSYAVLIRIQTAMVLLSSPCIIAGGVVALMKGYQPARYFLTAWLVLLVGVMAYAMVSFGLLPKVFVTEYGIQIGSSAEMILLSFALAYRINVLTAENQRMARETRELLEERVAERTGELNDALRQLETANQVLRESSERDGLTGVHNRRYLERMLRQQWARAIETEAPVSLIVMDLDHFKQVNDKRGHLAGDDCLKAVARAMLDGIAHENAILARYGGEEFFIVLPGWTLSDSKALAERLGEAVGALEIESEDQVFSITASFGVASVRPGAGADYRDLVRRADQAMYEAKRRGRNRVIAHSKSAN